MSKLSQLEIGQSVLHKPYGWPQGRACKIIKRFDSAIVVHGGVPTYRVRFSDGAECDAQPYELELELNQ